MSLILDSDFATICIELTSVSCMIVDICDMLHVYIYDIFGYLCYRAD